MTLAFSIETSCDETSVAIVDNNGKILNQITENQLDHNKFGGVVLKSLLGLIYKFSKELSPCLSGKQS